MGAYIIISSAHLNIFTVKKKILRKKKISPTQRISHVLEELTLSFSYTTTDHIYIKFKERNKHMKT